MTKGISTDFKERDSSSPVEKYSKEAIKDNPRNEGRLKTLTPSVGRFKEYGGGQEFLVNTFPLAKQLEYLDGRETVVVAQTNNNNLFVCTPDEYNPENVKAVFAGTVLAFDHKVIQVFMHLGAGTPKQDIAIYFPTINHILKGWDLPLGVDMYEELKRLSNKVEDTYNMDLFKNALMIKGKIYNPQEVDKIKSLTTFKMSEQDKLSAISGVVNERVKYAPPYIRSYVLPTLLPLKSLDNNVHEFLPTAVNDYNPEFKADYLDVATERVVFHDSKPLPYFTWASEEIFDKVISKEHHLYLRGTVIAKGTEVVQALKCLDDNDSTSDLAVWDPHNCYFIRGWALPPMYSDDMLEMVKNEVDLVSDDGEALLVKVDVGGDK